MFELLSFYSQERVGNRVKAEGHTDVGISMSSSTKSRLVVIFLTFKQRRLTCRQSVKRFRE